MHVVRNLAVASLLCAATSAHAEPISDPAAWTQQFVEQAAKSDVDGMGALVSSGAVPGLNVGGFPPGVQALLKGANAERSDNA